MRPASRRSRTPRETLLRYTYLQGSNGSASQRGGARRIDGCRKRDGGGFMTWSGGNEALDELPTQREVEDMLREAGAPYTVRHLPANTVLFWEGEPCPNHYFLAEGRIELYKVDSSYRKRSIDFYGPGCFFGYQIMRPTDLPMTTARACVDSQLIVIPRDSYFKALHGCPRFADLTVRTLFGLLSMKTNEVINSSFYAASQRVAILLLALAQDVEDRQVSPTDEIVLPYTNNDIAEMLGVSRNSVTSSISRMQEQGILKKGRSNICVVDMKGLERIATLSAMPQ